MNLQEFYEYTGIPSTEKIQRFKEIFEQNGADKSSSRHNYHNVYAALFQDDSVVNDILEIGIYHGASLRSWRHLFPEAHLVGLDNNTSFLFQEEKIRTLYVDQNNLPTFDYVYHILKNQKYELIIDDGSHVWENIVDTLNKTFPKWLNKSGWYIIEDIKLEDEDKAKKFAKHIEKEGFKTFLINMNDMVEEDHHQLFDNIILAVHKV